MTTKPLLIPAKRSASDRSHEAAEDPEVADALVAEVRRFVERDVVPTATRLELADEYPHQLVETMRRLGLFGLTIAPRYGGSGVSYVTYARIVEELCRGWMSLAGIMNSHLLTAALIQVHGSDELRSRLLPSMASGERRGGIALTEPHAGSDLQAIRTYATRAGDDYVVRGSKAFITNAVHGQIFGVLVLTDRNARPGASGMTVLIAEKGMDGLRAGRPYHKLGYRGVETAEMVFDDCRIPLNNRVGEEGQGFRLVMGVLEIGRINVAARAVGVAQAAFEAAIRYAQTRTAFGKPIAQHQAIQIRLAEMATDIAAARLLTADAAQKKDRGQRCDLEAGMAKLFASEMCGRVTLDAMRTLGGYGYTQEATVERHFRDAPLMIIGEGTNDIQRLVIARRLLEEYRTTSDG